jgi:hypothetical protein
MDELIALLFAGLALALVLVTAPEIGHAPSQDVLEQAFAAAADPPSETRGTLTAR